MRRSGMGLDDLLGLSQGNEYAIGMQRDNAWITTTRSFSSASPGFVNHRIASMSSRSDYKCMVSRSTLNEAIPRSGFSLEESQALRGVDTVAALLIDTAASQYLEPEACREKRFRSPASGSC